MSSTTIEQTRAVHAELEKSIRNIVFELQNKAKTQRGTVYQNTRINKSLENVQQKSTQLLSMYADTDGFRKQELDMMTGETLQKTLNSFDTRIAEIREYHRKFGSNSSQRTAAELAENEKPVTVDPLEPIVAFTGEEGYGRYVDMHQLYLEYINMPQFPRVDYATFLGQFFMFHTIKKQDKNEQYKQYLQNLYNYLSDFHQRANPLSYVEPILKKTEEEFEEKWNSGTVPGWENSNNNNNNGNTTKQEEQQKEASSNNGAAKQEKKKRKRNRGGKKTNYKDVALLESKITRYVEMLSDTIQSTKMQIEKKHNRTWEENQAEVEREENAEEILQAPVEDVSNEMDDDEDKEIGTNPLNLPLGWDGKPIPYWLYKLHGLNLEFKCEICGNYSYWGPRAFERHFQEWRHAHGMKCLKIPNTRHFHHITKIADAIELWENIKKQATKNNWKTEQEEYEDEHGNVFTKKTFEDLKRQGLL